MSLVRINPHWVPRVRHAARKYRKDVNRAQRRFEATIRKGGTEGEALQVQCAEDAQALMTLLGRLGYGGDRKKAPTRDRLELEIRVHELDEDVSINFFRVFLAQKRDIPLDKVFSRRGRKDTQKDAEALRWRHIDELKTTLKARNAAFGWLGLYYKRTELVKKYNEFCRVQFDDDLDVEAKAAYMGLLLAHVAQRSGRSPEEVLEEFNSMVKDLGIDVKVGQFDPEGASKD